jgi:hypothetical protein
MTVKEFNAGAQELSLDWTASRVTPAWQSWQQAMNATAANG